MDYRGKDPGKPKYSAIRDGIEAVAGLFRVKPPLYDGLAQSLAIRRLKSILKDSGVDALLSEIGGSEMKIQLIGGLIADKEYRAYAGWSLGAMAERGIDITPALPGLSEGMASPDKDTRAISIRALTSHWLNMVDFPSFSAMLRSSGPFMQRDAMEMAGSAASSGDYRAIRFLVRLLSDENEGIRNLAAYGLETVALVGGRPIRDNIREELEKSRKSSDIINIFEAKSRHNLIRMMDGAERNLRTY